MRYSLKYIYIVLNCSKTFLKHFLKKSINVFKINLYIIIFSYKIKYVGYTTDTNVLNQFFSQKYFGTNSELGGTNV